jgi:hypothetical protein
VGICVCRKDIIENTVKGKNKFIRIISLNPEVYTKNKQALQPHPEQLIVINLIGEVTIHLGLQYAPTP